jgi:hypothetical protein
MAFPSVRGVHVVPSGEVQIRLSTATKRPLAKPMSAGTSGKGAGEADHVTPSSSDNRTDVGVHGPHGPAVIAMNRPSPKATRLVPATVGFAVKCHSRPSVDVKTPGSQDGHTHQEPTDRKTPLP